MGPLVPYTHDRDTSGFFEAAAEGRLVVRTCTDCAASIHPPTAHCPHCGGWNTHWRHVAGTGRLHSWTTVTHQIHPAYPTPYTLVVVAVDAAPGVRLIGALPGAPVLHAEQPMRVRFEKLADGSVLPQWQIDETGDAS